ncbi:VapC toxin family PIN domain ribonuclease [Metarhizobium album]|uniref:Ribonuclease VapC n=1 Tax=Metarhizobium album TaxID=2182425 RepID=A0A2U2DX30_9HYPH|nr:type II toxin-antitoxin system VapC family toxin [Rhizobium album]PWE57856.1 VapC toxin family PIN domain ribonuclease [Rhizobium album]
MSGFLLDTNAISMFSPSQAKASEDFTAWLEEQERENGIYLSAVSIHEIEKGIRLLDHRGATAKASAIRFWLLGLVSFYGDNILPIDAAVAQLSGELEAMAVTAGHSPGAADAMIAGTAKAHGLTLVTRNLKHFEPFGIAVRSPDEPAP